ncbi:MAG: hypothetical protein ACMUIM_09845 [bacterium]
MLFKRFYLPFLLIMLLAILFSFSFSFAQTTPYYPNLYYYNYYTNPNAIYSGANLIYPYYQNYPYSPYQSSYYWPNTAGSYINPYSQYTASATNYIPLVTNPYASLGTNLNLGNSPYTYNPYGYDYSSLLYGSLGNYGYSSSLTNPYYQLLYNSTNYAGGTTGNYTAQATNYYPTIYPGIQPILNGAPSALSTNILNPFSNYLPNQTYYQNPFGTYPYNYGTGQIYPFNNYAYNPYNYYPTNYQSDPYSQPLPYYQPTNQANLSNVTGTWAGTWFTTLANGTVNNGDASLSLTQNGTEVYGSVTFSLNSYQKLNANINGTINGSTLSLTGTLSNGAETYTLMINANLSSNNLSGTYSIKTNSGSVIESGTYSVSRL